MPEISVKPAGAYPEDWQEQGWCCRECAVMAWYNMSLEVRRELLASLGKGTDEK